MKRHATSRRRTFLAASSIVAIIAGSAAAIAHSGGLTGSSPSRATMIGDQVLAELNDPRLQSIQLTGDTATITTKPAEDGLATIWIAKVAASAFIQSMKQAGISAPITVNYVDTSGKALDLGANGDRPSNTTPRPLPELAGGCSGAVATVPAQPGVTLISARTVNVPGDACSIVLKVDSTTSLDGLGHIVGQTISPITADSARAYLVTVLDPSNTPIRILGWVPGIGGDQGQGMGWSSPQLAAEASTGG